MGTKTTYIFRGKNVDKFRSGHGTNLACRIPTWQANAGESQAIGTLVPTTRPRRCGPTRARSGHKQEERKLKMHTKQRYAEPIAPATARLKRAIAVYGTQQITAPLRAAARPTAAISISAFPI